MLLSKQAIIDRTIKVINLLPIDKAEEISNFTGSVSECYEEQQLVQRSWKLVMEGHAFAFLHDVEELYTEANLKEVY